MKSSLVAVILALVSVLLLPSGSARSQTGDTAQPVSPVVADGDMAPAGIDTAECAWVGQRILMLLWRDDIDTANRFFNVYDRFNCPKGHSGLAFRCLVQLGVGEGEGDPGLPERAKACWSNPGLDPASFAPAENKEPPVDGSQPAQGDQPKSN